MSQWGCGFLDCGDYYLCALKYERRTAFIRVRWPSPCFLNHSNTSLSTRKCTDVFPGGMTTRARFQKSAPKGDASGALARVLLAPREIFLLIALREYLAVVSFCVISISLSCADNAHNVFAPPGARRTPSAPTAKAL